ncbi:MAG: cupin domain-containing protein [Betaproteobacteria bacterium]|nr:cupin domain-containing protein [Betaproteobacteria bacterium]
MPVCKLDEIGEELVTPKHSTALGRLVTGEQIEVGVLRFKAGEGATEHAHPQEQVLLVLSGRVRMSIGGQVHELGPREVAHMPPNVPHGLAALEDTEVVSAKGIVGGVGHRI